jgi:micrococcal nuclease
MKPIFVTVLTLSAMVLCANQVQAHPGPQNQYLQAENQAKQQRLGFWSQSNPVMPWDFRQGRKP